MRKIKKKLKLLFLGDKLLNYNLMAMNFDWVNGSGKQQ
jgi:hypothetical protein